MAFKVGVVLGMKHHFGALATFPDTSEKALTWRILHETCTTFKIGVVLLDDMKQHFWS